MRFTLLLGRAPRDAARIRAAEQLALEAAEAVVRLWEGYPPKLEAADALVERLRARLLDLDRARAESEWGARRELPCGGFLE